MSGFEFYLTPNDYLIAEENGISPENLTVRVRKQGWHKERAMTEPIKKYRDLSEWNKIAESNGISRNTMKARLHMGWDLVKASTTPLTDMKAQMLKNQAPRKYKKEDVDKAQEKGISYPRFSWRMKAGWTAEDAINTPILNGHEIGQRAAKGSYWSQSRKKVTA